MGIRGEKLLTGILPHSAASRGLQPVFDLPERESRPGNKYSSGHIHPLQRQSILQGSREWDWGSTQEETHTGWTHVKMSKRILSNVMKC